MTTILGIGVAGALGAWARYLVGLGLRRVSADFPWATLIINVSGCFLIAFVAGLAGRWVPLAPVLRNEVTDGFIGAYTTFSTFTVETLLVAEEEPALAAVYVGASLVAGLLAIVLGTWISGGRV